MLLRVCERYVLCRNQWSIGVELLWNDLGSNDFKAVFSQEKLAHMIL